jgi:ribosomal protein S18 acetylase RimI-like enzyme
MGIKLFGKNICRFYKHHIMRLEYKETAINPDLHLCKIDLDHIAEELKPIGTTVTVNNLNRLARMNTGRCEGFKLVKGEQSVGTIWILYKGADDLEYRIRNIDAYIFDVFVNNAYRGRGYAGEMIRQLMCHLHGKGIDTAHLAVSVSNESAIRAYKKTGFTIMKDLNFARILKINIPYHIL